MYIVPFRLSQKSLGVEVGAKLLVLVGGTAIPVLAVPVPMLVTIPVLAVPGDVELNEEGGNVKLPDGAELLV